MRQNLIVLRGESDALRRTQHVQGLDAGVIARQQQTPRLCIVERDREHAVEAAQRIRPPRDQRLQRHFGVTAGLELHAAAGQFAAQLTKVVDLAIEDDRVAAIFGHHRLMSGGRQIENRQAAERPSNNACRATTTRLGRPAHAGHHLTDMAPVSARRRVRVGEFSGDSTHSNALRRFEPPFNTLRPTRMSGLCSALRRLRCSAAGTGNTHAILAAVFASVRIHQRVNSLSKSARPRVTVAIPTFNRADKTLPATLRSAVDQTYPNLDIVVSDNCSTDATEAVVRGFGDHIRYVRQAENLGLNGNLNACIDLAEGDYVLVLHDDDLIDADFVESCMDAVADSTNVGLIRTGMRIIRSDGSIAYERPNRAIASRRWPI